MSGTEETGSSLGAARTASAGPDALPRALSPLQVWLAGSRPRTLVAGAAPVLVGAAAAWGAPGYRPVAVLLALIGALALQAASNMINDVGDGQSGIDTARRVGPLRLVASGLAAPGQMWLAAGTSILIAFIAGIGLALMAGWPIVAIGLLAILTAAGYTVGPAPLGRLGLGELAAFVFFGPVAVLGTAAAATGRWSDLPLVWSLPTGLLAGALMMANNLRDRESDAAVGKRTIAVRNATAARLLYRAMIAGAVGVPLVLSIWSERPLVALAAGVMSPFAMRAALAIPGGRSGRELAPALGRMADLFAVTTFALVAALIASHGA